MSVLKDKKVVALAIILLIFTVFYFVIANKISYAFEDDMDSQEIYNNTLDIIKKSAIAYGEDNLELLMNSEDKTIYPQIQELIDKGYLIPNNENGNMTNPNDNKEILNSTWVKIKYVDGKISADINK